MENLELILHAECKNSRITLQMPYDTDIRGFLEACQTLAIGLTFAPETWEHGVRELAWEYEDKDPGSKCNNDE